MSNQSIWGGYNLPIIVVLLGVLGIFIDLLFLVAFFAVLGYYLYRIEKRLTELEQGKPPSNGPKPKQG